MTALLACWVVHWLVTPHDQVDENNDKYKEDHDDKDGEAVRMRTIIVMTHRPMMTTITIVFLACWSAGSLTG